MKKNETTASVLAEQLAVAKENLHMNISTFDQSLKLRIILVALDEHISYRMADGVIKFLGYRGV